MKKTLLFVFAAILAAVLTASSGASENYRTEGKVSFESSKVPALNCALSIDRARALYWLIPTNICDLCTKEYAEVRNKSNKSSHFKHEGVDVRITEKERSITVELSFGGYRIVANDVTWAELDSIFFGPESS